MMHRISGKQIFESNFVNGVSNGAGTDNGKTYQDCGKRIVSQNSSAMEFLPSNQSSKMKIRLVSPLKIGNTLKENRADPQMKNSNQFRKERTQGQEHAFDIQLGKKTEIKPPVSYQSPKAHTINILELSTKPFTSSNRIANNKENKAIMQSFASIPAFPERGTSPSKIRINNKCFDIGSIHSKVAIVTPLYHQTLILPSESYAKTQNHNKNCASQFSIQQQDSMQNLKGSYQSDMREIKKLQQEIEENSVQIKELLKGNNRMTSTSRVSINNDRLPQITALRANPNFNPSMETRQTLINELDFAPSNHSESHKDQISVQTDNQQIFLDHSQESNYRKSPKFAICRNNQCQIKVVCSREEGQLLSHLSEPSQYTFAHETDLQSDSPLKSQVKMEQIWFSARKDKKVLQQEIIPVSQMSLVPENFLIPYEIKVNLKSSRAQSEQSIIEENSSIIQLQQSSTAIISAQRQPINVTKSTSKIIPSINPHAQALNPSINHPQTYQKYSSIATAKAQGGSISSTRRMNNSKYL